MKSVLAILVLNFFLVNHLYSQIASEERVEIELNDGYINEELIEFGENGLVLVSQRKKDENKKTELKFVKYNKNLKEDEAVTISFSDKLRWLKTAKSDDELSVFLRSSNGAFMLITMDVSDMSYKQVEGEFSKKLYVSDIEINENVACLSTEHLGNKYFPTMSYLIGRLKRKTQTIVTIDKGSGKVKEIPIEFNNKRPKETSIENIQVVKNEFFISVKSLEKKRKNEMHVWHLDENGRKENVFNLSKNIDQNIIDVSSTKIEGDKFIFTGTYSTTSTGTSEGIFFFEARGNRISYTQFYKYLDLENFLTYLPKKRQEKIEKKEARKKKKGKELKISYQMAIHDVLPVDGGYIFLGEAYYPTYRSETRTVSTANGVSTTTVLVFDGYQYTHAVIAKFDSEGNMEWDQTFELWSAYKPYNVIRFISVSGQSDKALQLVFSSRNKITSKSIDFNGEVSQESSTDPIETSYEKDKVKRSYSDMVYWYDNYFIAYGNQIIKNKTKSRSVERKRKVYFINKIEFEE